MVTKSKITHFICSKKHISIATVLILTLAAGGYVFSSSLRSADPDTSENTATKELYKQDIGALKEAVTSLSSLLESNQSYQRIDNIGQHTDEYEAALLRAKEPCERIVERYDTPATGNLNDTLADTASNSRSICNDTLLIVDYAKTVSVSITPYMTFNETGVSDEDTVKKLINASQQSIDHLQTIDNPGIEDPGRQEIIVQLENTRDAATALLNELEEKPNADMGELTGRVQADKQNFLNAQSYFWNNTVMLNRLEAITKRVYSEF